jgi:excisionase family DNA binding protein
MTTTTTAPPSSGRYLRPNTIAERTGRHPESIRKAIRAGEMKAVRLGRRAIGVHENEYARWLDDLQK